MLVDIQNALDSRFATLPGQKAWPGVPFSPTVGVPYAAASVAARAAEHVGIGPGQPRFWRGAYQIMVAHPTGEGLKPAHETVESVLALFQRGLNLTSNNANVIVERSWAAQPYPSGDWINIPVTIEWLCEERP